MPTAILTGIVRDPSGAVIPNVKVVAINTGTNLTRQAITDGSGTYRIVAQPTGEMPTLIGTARLGEAIVVNTDLDFCIETSETDGQQSFYDNVSVTAGARP